MIKEIAKGTMDVLTDKEFWFGAFCIIGFWFTVWFSIVLTVLIGTAFRSIFG